MSARPRINIAWSMVSILAKNGLTLVSFMVLARCIEPAAFGSISLTLMVWGFLLSFVDSGFTSVVVRQQELDRNLLSTLYWWNAALGTATAILLIASGPYAAVYFNDPRLTHLFLYAGFALFFVSLGQQFITVLQQRLAFVRIAPIEIGAAVIGCTVTIIRVKAGAGAASYFEGLLVGNVVLSCAAYAVSRRYFTPAIHFALADLRAVFGFGLLNTGERCVSFITTNIEKPLIGRWYSMGDLGLYSIVNQLITRPVSLISNAFSRVAYSMYAKVHKDHLLLNTLYIRYSGKLALITFPLYGFIYLFSDSVIGILFGNAYLQATAYITPLCVLGAIWSIGNPIGSYLMALNKARAGLLLNCFVAGMTLLVLFFGSRYSMSTMLSMWVVMVIVVLLPVEWTLRYRLTRMPMLPYLGAILPHAAVVLMLAGAGKYTLQVLSIGWRSPLIIVPMVVYLGLYGLYGWKMYGWMRRQED